MVWCVLVYLGMVCLCMVWFGWCAVLRCVWSGFSVVVYLGTFMVWCTCGVVWCDVGGAVWCT